MTSQLHESSEQLESTNRDLQTSNQALEERRRYTETVLQNIPTGVISITAEQKISRVNKAVQRMLNCDLELINPGLDALFRPRDLARFRRSSNGHRRRGSQRGTFGCNSRTALFIVPSP